MQRAPYCRLRTILLFGLLCLPFITQAQAAQRTVLVVGDSISAAYGMSLEQGWVALMAGQLAQQHPGTSVINASISGETTGGALRRLPALLSAHQPSLVIIELGGNDGLRGYPIGKLRDNLNALVQQSREIGAGVILVPMEIPPNYGSRYTSAFRDSYREVATANSTTLAPFLLDGVAGVDGLMQADGIHPTVEAQQLLLDNILPSVLNIMEPK
jgi:acyl-CoA thioesterase I